MKIHLRGRPKQYSLTKVTCLDSLMVEMLHCVPDSTLRYSVEEFAEMRCMTGLPAVVHRFLHGAQLQLGPANNEFYICCYMPDGSDGLAAIEELQMLDNLRLARKHFHAMKKACYRPELEHVSLRVTQY